MIHVVKGMVIRTEFSGGCEWTYATIKYDPWPIVSLAFFLRYPNPYGSHILSCDVISREFTSSGSLLTSRLILKKATLPRCAPKGIFSQSEVDPYRKVCVKAMQIHENQTFSQLGEGKTLQTTEARIVSGFRWGLTKQIENYGLTRFRKNVQRSREGVDLILDLIRQLASSP
ncbi:hypothetical protein EDB89DRAFT_2130202 [Lactarius sanguifluus]|nr:hypothetical protein EDB89DRAFT_2130202 [Lactarius sanguifluus]